MENNIFRGEVEPVRDEILYDIANFENMNLTINVPNTWPNGTLVVNIQITEPKQTLLTFTGIFFSLLWVVDLWTGLRVLCQIQITFAIFNFRLNIDTLWSLHHTYTLSAEWIFWSSSKGRRLQAGISHWIYWLAFNLDSDALSDSSFENLQISIVLYWWSVAPPSSDAPPTTIPPTGATHPSIFYKFTQCWQPDGWSWIHSTPP